MASSTDNMKGKGRTSPRTQSGKAVQAAKKVAKVEEGIRKGTRPYDLGERGKALPQSSGKPRAISDTTNTGRQTRTTVAQPGGMSLDKTSSIQKQKVKKTVRKMKETLRSAKPSGVTKTARLAAGARAVSRSVPLIGAAAALASTAKKPGKSPPEETRPLFKRKK